MFTTLLTVLALTGASPQAQDQQWLAFEGCWRPIAEQAAAAPLVCIRESAGGAVMATYVAGERKSEQRITADGVARPISEGGCTGEEVGRWSKDGTRVYLRARLSCGTGMERITTGSLALVGIETLVEVQALRVGDGSTVRSIRYQSVSPTEYPAGFALAAGQELARETARVHAAATLDVADVIEASQQIEAGALDALLAARPAGFALSAGTLRELAAAGVARSTLDVMVALSYPQEFVVAEGEPDKSMVADRPEPYGRYYDPFDNYSCYRLSYYSPYACDYRYGWSPFGYGSYGGYYGGYGGGYGGYYGGGGIVVIPVDDEGNPKGQGGTVGPEGYTRGTQPTKGTARPRSEPTSRTGPRSSVQPGRSSTGSAGPSSSSGSSGSSGRGSVSSGGTSAGSGSTSKGTAKARGGG